MAYAGGARLRATRDATTATVIVEDDGPCIATREAADRSHLRPTTAGALRMA